mgnify:CR=1 FL=1
MSQDNWHIVASHLAILKAGGTVMFLDTTLPDAMITHMLNDARPVLVLTRGQDQFRDLPTLNVLKLPALMERRDAAGLAGRPHRAAWQRSSTPAERRACRGASSARTPAT